MKLSDVYLTRERDGKRVELGTPTMPFLRTADGVWLPYRFVSPAEAEEVMGLETNPNVVKSFIIDLINSPCEMPSQLRSDLQALL